MASEVNLEALKEAVLAVEENNRLNNAKWSDWDDADHIATTYEIAGLGPREMQLLAQGIQTNGASVEEAMQQLHAEVWGVEFNTWR